METANLDRIRIVLVEPQDGANIGSVCRAMKTMGITDLAITGDREYDINRVKTLGLHAFDLYENHRRFSTLDEALEGSILTVAATRRRGKFRKADPVNPEQLAEKINEMGEGIISIVFGRECDGLRDDEVNKCSMVVSIPTSEKFPSLNLSQAVQIVTYSLYNRLKPYPVKANPVTVDRIKTSCSRAIDIMDRNGYFKQEHEKFWTESLLDDVITRAHLSESELQRFLKIFTKESAIEKYKEKDDGKLL